MTGLQKLVGFVGLADSLWIALNPRAWAKFWEGMLDRAAKDRGLAIGLAALELVFSLRLLRRTEAERAR